MLPRPVCSARAITPRLTIFCSPASLCARSHFAALPAPVAITSRPNPPPRPGCSMTSHQAARGLLFFLPPPFVTSPVSSCHAPGDSPPPFFLSYTAVFAIFHPFFAIRPGFSALFASPGLFLLSPTLRAPFAPYLPRHNTAPAETFLPRQSPRPKKEKDPEPKNAFPCGEKGWRGDFCPQRRPLSWSASFPDKHKKRFT